MKALNFSNSLTLIIMVFMVIGGIDQIRGNKHGYGEKFIDGFKAMSAIAIPLIGMMTLAPVISVLVQPVLSSMFSSIGISPAMIPSLFIGSDMGAYPIAVKLAEGDVAIQNYSGLLLSTMMGVTIAFTFPVGLSLLDPEKSIYFASGTLVGLTTIPVGMIIGGIMMNFSGFPISFSKMAINLLPLVFLVIAITLGMLINAPRVISGFIFFGNALNVLFIIGILLAVIQQQTGIRFPLFYLMLEKNGNGLTPLQESFQTIGTITIILIGAFPLIKVISKMDNRLTAHIQRRLGISKVGSAGMIATTASVVATFNMLSQMTPKDILLNAAFAVSAAFMFGDFLGYVLGMEPAMVIPMIVGKAFASVSALLLCNFLSPHLLSEVAVQ